MILYTSDGPVAAGPDAMEFQVDIWLRGTDFATTRSITSLSALPSAWTDQDVARLLREMLLAIHRTKNPDVGPDMQVFLRGFSWIVNPFEDKGVVVAIEIQTGAAVAGPFEIDKQRLEQMISRAIALGKTSTDPPSALVH
jgi:hypothetical protein